ncbi:MAG TPA: hypothetical protein VLM80_01405 [Anaerolineales bacterium]|nr:hypothetical protein [Anaerolineales bacterium]
MSEKNEEGKDNKPESIFTETQKRIAGMRQAVTKSIAEHTVVGGDTLGGIAQKYYGHATPDYWQLIYQANKAVIGDNPNVVKRGIVLKIPELPQNLKK